MIIAPAKLQSGRTIIGKTRLGRLENLVRKKKLVATLMTSIRVWQWTLFPHSSSQSHFFAWLSNALEGKVFGDQGVPSVKSDHAPAFHHHDAVTAF